MYRATFPLTFNEIRNYGKGEGWKVFFGVTVGITISVFLANFLRRTGQLFISAQTIIEGCVHVSLKIIIIPHFNVSER